MYSLLLLGAATVPSGVKEIIEAVAKVAGVAGIALALGAFLIFSILGYLERIGAPAPGGQIVEWILIVLVVGTFICILTAIVGWIIVAVWPKPSETAAIHLTADDGKGPPSFVLKGTIDGRAYQGEGISNSGTMSVPSQADRFVIQSLDAPGYQLDQEARNLPKPWEVPILEHTIELQIKNDLSPPDLPKYDSLRELTLSKTNLDVASSPQTMPDNYTFSADNETNRDIRLWLFNCRHLKMISDHDSEVKPTVSVLENGGISVYPKWLSIEVKAHSNTDWPSAMIKQFFQPSGWFVAVATAPKTKNLPAAVETICCDNFFKKTNSRLVINNPDGGEKFSGELNK
jgi:hypothetical protein